MSIWQVLTVRKRAGIKVHALFVHAQRFQALFYKAGRAPQTARRLPVRVKQDKLWLARLYKQK